MFLTCLEPIDLIADQWVSPALTSPLTRAGITSVRHYAWPFNRCSGPWTWVPHMFLDWVFSRESLHQLAVLSALPGWQWPQTYKTFTLENAFLTKKLECCSYHQQVKQTGARPNSWPAPSGLPASVRARDMLSGHKASLHTRSLPC